MTPIMRAILMTGDSSIEVGFVLFPPVLQQGTNFELVLRDLTRPDFDYGNGIEMVPIPHAQLTVAVGEDNSVSRSLEVSLPCTFEAGSVSLDMSSSSNSVESSSQWSSSFNDMDWDMDSSSTF